MELDEKQLRKINGGSGWTILGIIGGLFFLVGILDGIARPSKCEE